MACGHSVECGDCGHSECDSQLISDTQAWRELQDHVDRVFNLHLKDLMQDTERCKSMIKEFDGIVLDYSRQRATQCTFSKLLALAREANVKEKIDAMFSGIHINKTEDRPVLHAALRAPRNVKIMCDGKDVVPEVWEVLDKMKSFSDQVRQGSWVGETGKVLKDVVAIGIGGSYLGPLFAYTALQTDSEAAKLAHGRRLRFLANVDPVDVAIAINGLSPETTLDELGISVLESWVVVTSSALNA